MSGARQAGVLGVLLALTAGAFDAEPLLVPAVALIALAAGAAGWVALAAQGVHVERTIDARRVVEDEPLAVEVRVRTGEMPIPGGLLEDPLLPAPVPVGTARSPRLRISAHFARRGRRTLLPPALVVRDPLGLAERRVTGSGTTEILVLPRTGPVTVRGEGGGALSGLSRPSAAAEVEPDGLRGYREGTPASRIHWPAYARGSGLLERRLRADSDVRPLVVLDPRAPASEEDLDRAVRATASICLHLARHGGCSVLLPGDRRPSAIEDTLGTWPGVHARLALVDSGMAPAAATVGPRRGAIVYVAARVPPRPPRALANAPGGGRLLVVPGGLHGHSPAFEVMGCRGYELGRTASRRLMRATA